MNDGQKKAGHCPAAHDLLRQGQHGVKPVVGVVHLHRLLQNPVHIPAALSQPAALLNQGLKSVRIRAGIDHLGKAVLISAQVGQGVQLRIPLLRHPGGQGLQLPAAGEQEQGRQ